jgi:MFS family permease
MLGPGDGAMRFPAGLRALNHRDFRRFYGGQLVSLVGTWMQTVGQAWLVLSLTDSPFLLGLIGTIQYAPIMAFVVLSGAVVDRLPKRRVLLVTQAALAVQAFTLAALVAAGHVRYWHVAVLAFLYGLVNSLDMPARQSFVATLVGRGDVASAVSLNSAAFNTARMVGPAVAGLLIARVGVAPAFVLNGLSFVCVLAALATVRAEGAPAARVSAGMAADIRSGLAYAFRTPRIRLALGVVFLLSLFVFNFTVSVPLLARDVLGLGAEGFGFLMAALGIGAVGGALMLGAVGRTQPPVEMILTTAVVACGATLALAAVTHFAMAVAVLLVVGFASIATAAACNTTLQVTAPDELRGRVMSLYALVFGGTFPLASFLVGIVAEHWGVRTVFVVNGALGLVGLLAVLVTLARRRA